jgi:UDP-N-acetylglucosamine--N-acetylmuramyl-(pentapeptide) pyrophosphoryl-undecaprenol N-acetylglucosamine transferase
MAPTIVIAAGGTAGHVVPAVAVADALRAEAARVVFVGGERAERTLVPQAGYELRPIAVEGLSRSNPLKAARAAAKAVGAVGAPAPSWAAAATSPGRWGWPRSRFGSRSS